ncbi:hypothetical protein MTO96_030552 [Rhipicephalus appendiculatus]
MRSRAEGKGAEGVKAREEKAAADGVRGPGAGCVEPTRSSAEVECHDRKKQATSRFQLLHVVTVHAVGRRPLRSAGSQVEVDYELVPIHQDCSMGTTLFDLMTAAMSAVHY